MPKRILIVEDTPANFYVLQRVFLKEGFEVIQAGNGREAIGKAESDAPDVILMDMRLPDMSGYEAIPEIRRNNSAVPIIAVTADALPGDKESCLSLGCAAYFSKPIQYREIVEKVLQILSDPDQHKGPAALAG
ncbi:MAG: response regulator [Nitrospirae bacterium]|nr:response regulator [Candidatus Manganitrophaceae bacterium]